MGKQSSSTGDKSSKIAMWHKKDPFAQVMDLLLPRRWPGTDDGLGKNMMILVGWLDYSTKSLLVINKIMIHTGCMIGFCFFFCLGRHSIHFWIMQCAYTQRELWMKIWPSLGQQISRTYDGGKHVNFGEGFGNRWWNKWNSRESMVDIGETTNWGINRGHIGARVWSISICQTQHGHVHDRCIHMCILTYTYTHIYK